MSLFFAYEYLENAKFYADFKSVNIIGIKCTREKLLTVKFRKSVIEKRANPNIYTPFANNFFVGNFTCFPSGFEIGHKIQHFF
jgi:hypothetical protein